MNYGKLIRRILAPAIVLSSLIGAGAVFAQEAGGRIGSGGLCLSASGDTRLANYCLINEINAERLTDPRGILTTDGRLKKAGFEEGLGFPGALPRFDTDLTVTPIFSYSRNVNGGNNSDELTLGAITFETDPDLLRKAGVLVGAGLQASGLYRLGGGDTITGALGFNASRAPQHGAEVIGQSQQLCYQNYMGDNTFANFCGARSVTRYELSESRQRSLTAGITRYFQTAPRRYTGLSAQIERVFSGDTAVTSLGFAARQKTRAGDEIGLNATFGLPVSGQHVQRFGFQASYSTKLNDRALTLSAGVQRAYGSQIFGIAREDRGWSLQASYALTDALSVQVGYRRNDSSIDYFDERAPVIGVSFEPFRW